MNKNIALRAGAAKLGGKLVETYERKSNAEPSVLEALGLDPNADNYAQIGITSINEYIRLIARGVKRGKRHTWAIKDLGQDVEIHSVWIDSPHQDSFDLELYAADGSKPLDLTISRNKAPYNMPNAILTQDLHLKIFARADINTVAIICSPAVLLGDYPSQETIAAMTQSR